MPWMEVSAMERLCLLHFAEFEHEDGSELQPLARFDQQGREPQQRFWLQVYSHLLQVQDHPLVSPVFSAEQLSWRLLVAQSEACS